MLIGQQTSEGQQAINTALQHCQHAAVEWPEPVNPEWDIGLLGPHQRQNAGVAWRAAELLLANLFDPDIAQRGLAGAQIPARCQLVHWHGRQVLIDSAHHDHSLAATIQTAQELFNTTNSAGNDSSKWHMIFGCASDKDIERMLKVLPEDMSLCRCGFISLRARGPEDWGRAWLKYPWFDDVAAALDHLDQLPKDEHIVISGSFYLAGEALDLVGE